MEKAEVVAKLKVIGLRAAEDVVKDIAIPYVRAKAIAGGAGAMALWAAIEGAVKKAADGIDGEEG